MGAGGAVFACLRQGTPTACRSRACGRLAQQKISAVCTKSRIRIIQGVAALTALWGATMAPVAACTVADDIVSAASGGPWYATVAPTEHFDSARTQRFPYTCTLQQLSGAREVRLVSRKAPGSYPALYNVVTRDVGELFVYGGYAGQDAGAYLAKLHADTLVELWRRSITIPSSQWSFIGGLGVLADGYVYSVLSNLLVKADPATGTLQTLALPQMAAPTGTGAAFNGFVVNPDGLIFTKSMERGPCDRDTSGGLGCVLTNALPSTIAVVDSQTMSLVAAIQTAEPALGRIATERHDGVDYIYVPGVSQLVRYRYVDGELSLDDSWGPVSYGSTGANASGVGVIGDYVVAQTNYVPMSTPSWIIAANIHDGTEQYAMQPFTSWSGELLPASWVPDKAALDPENGMIYAEDMYAGQVAGIRIGPAGFELKWKVSDIAKGFPALFGPAEERQLLVPQLVPGGDRLSFRQTLDGELSAASEPLVKIGTIGASVPGFRGRFYYPSFSSGELWETTVIADR